MNIVAKAFKDDAVHQARKGTTDLTLRVKRLATKDGPSTRLDILTTTTFKGLPVVTDISSVELVAT